MANATPGAAPKRSKFLLVLLVVGLLAAGAGGVLPLVLASKGTDHGAHGGHDDHAKPGKKSGPALIAFGETAVPLADGRLTRYIRVKLMLVVDDAKEKDVTELLTKKKAFLKNWLIGYLSDRSLEDVRGAAGVNRLRREIRDQFNTLLFPDSPEQINDVLFEDFLIQ